MFKNGLSIQKFTAMTLPKRVIDIVDSSMPFEEDDDDDETNNEQVDRHFNAGSRAENCLVSVLQIKLLCS